jgi:prefoldin beta subunit
MAEKREVSEELESAFKAFQAAQEEVGEQIRARQQLVAQHSENQFVSKEFETLEADGEVFKLVGPVLIKQELGTAKENVEKRKEYINTEIDRYTKTIEEGEKKVEEKKAEVLKLQKQEQ